jgi:arylsulfatase A-like enzyme
VGPVFSIDFVQELQAGDVVLDEAELAYATALYDGDLRKSDRVVAEFLSSLERLGLHDRTLVVITSDHGEELGEHYPAHTGDHGHALLDSLLRVPLLLHDPTRDFPVKEVKVQVRLLDVVPTVAELLGVVPSPDATGRSLVPLMTGEETAERLALFGQTHVGPRRFGVRSAGFKYIASIGPDRGKQPMSPAPPEHQLYDLLADPGERSNVVAQLPQMAVSLQQLLHDEYEGGVPLAPTPDDVDPRLRERLESLGYVR